MHLDTYTFTDIHILTDTHVFSCVLIQHTHPQVYIHVLPHSHTHIHRCVHYCTQSPTSLPIHTLTHSSLYMHVHTFTHTHTHTHTHLCYVLNHWTNSKLSISLSLVTNTPEFFPITSQEARHLWRTCQLHSLPFFSQEDAPLPESYGRSPGHPGGEQP